MTFNSKIRSRAACVSILFGFSLAATAVGTFGASIRDQADTIVIENRFARMVIGKDGTTRSFQDVQKGTEYLDRRFPVYFMSARRRNAEFGSSEITRRGSDLDIKFGGSGIEVRLRVGADKDYFTFEVLFINQINLDELIFVELPLTISERVARVQERKEHSETINVCRNENFGVNLSSINLIAHSRTTRYEPAAFRSSCYPRFGMVGAKAAIVAGPSDQILNLIGGMEVDQGLPHPTLGGEWGKTSREIQKSYLFVDFTEENIDRVIAMAQAGGFSYILNYGGTWSTSSGGKYEVNTRNFPRGLPGLKAIMDKIHSAGLKGGAHILSGCVDKNNAYVTPIPDPRLLKDDMRILAGDVGASETDLVLTSSPTGFPTIEDSSFDSGKSLIIDDEVITYESLKTDPPFALEGCKRGAYGTRASAHRAGSRVYHLGQRWGMFVLNGDSDLLQEAAQNIADVINYCGFDQLYFDGLDGVEVNGPFFYYVGKLVQETTKRFKREVIVQGSNLAHINWHDFSRLYTIDFAVLNPKRWVDHHCAERMVNARNNMIPAELGWFGYFLDTPHSESTTPDIVEYVLAKTIGWNVPWSLETNMLALEGNGRTSEALALSKIYEELRLKNYFSDRIKEILRTPKQDFKLVHEGSGDWQLHPINYGPPQLLALQGGTKSQFSYKNPFQEQPLKFRIKARPSPAPFGDSSNRVLLDPDRVPDGKAESGNPDFSLKVERSSEQVKTGRNSLKLTASNRSSKRSSWASHTFKLDAPLDLNENRAIGFWVYGDGSGTKLNVRLDDERLYFSRSHYVELDFTGWKYCEIAEPSVDPVMEYPYLFVILTSLRNFAYDKVGSVTVLLTDAPAGKTVTCYLARVEGLKEHPTTLVNPILTLNGSAVRLPVTLENSHYVEYWGEKNATVYDKNGHILRQLSLAGTPRLRAGANRVELGHEDGSGGRSEVRVELIAMGDAIR
jgi:hypothetical protein